MSSPAPIITIDTNVFISGATILNTPPGQIFSLWEEKKVDIALSEPILQEIRGVMLRPYFRSISESTEATIDRYIYNLRLTAIIVPGTININICRDPDDNKIFACAIESNSKYIISGDKDILAIGEYKKIKTITPRSFVEKFKEIH